MNAITILAVAACLATASPAAAAWWKPSTKVNFDYQLGVTFKLNSSLQPAAANVTSYGIDIDTNTATVKAMIARGLQPVCYFSAGSIEKWRADAAKFPVSTVGKTLDGWPDERWLDVRSAAVRAIMVSRMETCRSKGFVAVDPDNVDGWSQNTGFPLTKQDLIDFNRFLATAAHALGLAIGLKNDVEQIPDLVGFFDFAINESCWQYNECSLYAPFFSAGKPVWNVEYSSSSTFITKVCTKAVTMGIKSMRKNLLLDKARLACSNA